jgi:hypothetical protein
MSKINRQGNLRRKLLKSAFVGGGILGTSHITMDKWLTPVIDSVMLPAHALTSPSSDRYYYHEEHDIHPAPGAIGALLGMADSRQDNLSIASQLAEILFPSAHAATAPQPTVATRLEMYLEKMPDNTYKFVLSMTATETGLKLVLFGTDFLRLGANTMHLAICNGNPKPHSISLESVSVKGASILIPGYPPFELLVDPSATAPVKQACSTT